MSIGIRKTFNLDMVPGGAPPIIHVSAEDVGRPYRAVLLYNGEVYEVQGNRLTIAGTKPDGTVFEYPVDDFETDESYADFTIKAQMAIVPGMVRCKLREYLNDDQIGSATFILDVDEYVYDPEAASESYIPSYETAIQEALENVADDIADLATAAAINDVKQYSDAASASATAAAGSATSAQTSAGTATTAAGSATSAAEDAEDSADRAEAAAESMAAYNTDRTPYLLRQSGGGVETGDREYDTVVGGTVALNQLVVNNKKSYTNSETDTRTTPEIYLRSTNQVSGSYVFLIGTTSITQNGNFARIVTSPSSFKQVSFWHNGSARNFFMWTGTDVDVVKDHKYLFSVDFTGIDPTTIGGFSTDNLMFIDLTQMFGSTIADYIYSLEQGTAGAGVAWFRQFFPEDYYEYNAGELKSVSGVSAHVMRDAEDNIIGNYPLDDSLTLRGIPKLDANNQLYYDGDTYEADGTVTRKYGVVTINGTTGTWLKSSSYPGGYYIQGWAKYFSLVGSPNHVQDKMETVTSLSDYSAKTNIVLFDNSLNVKVDNSLYPTVDDFKTYLNANPIVMVYELITATTETADPFTNPQVVDPDGTEEYVTDSIVPVGHDTRYRVNLRDKLEPILDAPTTDGTYTLTVTVSNGIATYSWASQ